MNHRLSEAGLALLAFATILGLAGCAAPASREGMLAAPAVVTHQSPQSVAVRTAGGNDTGAMDSSNISDADLKAAIEDSIAKTGVFRQVVQGDGGDYLLSVTVVRLSKPLMGFSMTVEMEASWSLVRNRDKSAVLRKTINSTFTATTSDAFAGATRLRMAVEGAARANIAQGLEAIAALKL